MKNLENQESNDLLRENHFGHLAFIADNKSFVIPITYYYDSDENKIIAYSGPGHKIDSMRINPSVAFQVEEVNSINSWRSVLIHGEFEEINGAEAKYELHKFAEGVKNVISEKENRNLQYISEFSSDIYAGGTTIVYKIKITDIIGKQMEE